MFFDPPQSGLTLIHGNRIELLRDDLVHRLQADPLAPLVNETILVQSNGMAQWLKLGLAEAPGVDGGGGLGIAAALELLLPARFVWRVYRAVLGGDAVPEETPFDKMRLVWRLLRLLPGIVAGEPFVALRHFLREDPECRKVYQLAERLADLFDQYQVYRADWLSAWARGDDVLIDARGQRIAMPEEQRWQAQLWRILIDDVARGAGEAPHGRGRAEVHAAFLRRAREESRPPVGLPGRVTIFGISSLPYQSLEVFMALSRWTRVLMYVHNPCQAYWADVIAGRELFRSRGGSGGARGRSAISDDEALHLQAQPLLAAWGMQGRDFIGLLEDAVGEGALWSEGVALAFEPERESCFVGRAEEARTLLWQLQEDILELRSLDETRALWPPVDATRDGSLRFHIAHGAGREVEILHDQLLAAFNADASLNPRDVLVMVPDIDAYAAHIQAVFGLHALADPRFIPFVVVNRTRRRVDPLLRVVEKLLALPRARVTANDLLEWLELPSLRRCFGIGGEDLPLLRRWIRDAGIRWGLDARHCATLGVPEDATGERTRHTWRFGLERMLLGYALGDRGTPWMGIDPFDEIGLGDGELLGRLSELVAAVERSWHELSTPATVPAWCGRLRGLLTRFFDPDEADADAMTLLRLEEVLAPWEAICAEAGLEEPLPGSLVAEYWLSCLEDGGLSRGFFAGAVTFATLMPMRAIPFRQVHLLGMNDGAYPRPTTRIDFDLLQGRYRPGDRSRREDDRYLFLEALLSARERLVISWVGRGIHDNAELPPSVLVGQLRDHLAAGWTLARGDGAQPDAGAALVEALTTVHPLQPFSLDYFPAGINAASSRFTYAREWRPARRIGLDAEAGVAMPSLLPPLRREEPLRLLDLARLFKDPVKSFFQQRLGVRFEREDLFLQDYESFGMNALEQWGRIDELLSRREPEALEQGLARMRLRGALPAGGHGERLAGAMRETMTRMNGREERFVARWPEEEAGERIFRLVREIEGGTVTVVDRLRGVRHGSGSGFGRIVRTASRLLDAGAIRPEALSVPWVAHLAWGMVAGDVTTVVLGRDGAVELAPLPSGEAERALVGLMEAWVWGMRAPLAFLPAVGWVGGDEPQKAEKRFIRERGLNPYVRRVFGDFSAFAALGEREGWSERLLEPLREAASLLEELNEAAVGDGWMGELTP
ncbi:MAG: exodeoxyribonuclease V subunit gamma [Magnetococcales bacterium]|nr:exodeoxyribonuclease V subunit gamma [Magnetococcales bacterium]